MDAQCVSVIDGPDGVAAYLKKSPEYRNSMCGLFICDTVTDDRIFEYGENLVRVEFFQCVVSPFQSNILDLMPKLRDIVFSSCDVPDDIWRADTHVSDTPCVHLHFVCCTGAFRDSAPVTSFKNIVALTIDQCNEIEELSISNRSDLATITIVKCAELFAVHFVPSNTVTANYQMCYVKIASNPKLRLITGLEHCPNIHNLELSDNVAMRVMPDLNVLPHLDLLDIDGCVKLTEFPPIDVTLVPTLRRLQVSNTNCQIQAASEKVISQHSIEMLWYGSPGRYQVPDAIVKLASLKNLGLTGQLVNLDDVCGMSQLTELHLELAHITEIPICIMKLNRNLVTLHLMNCGNLGAISDWLGGLTQLCNLFITGCTKLRRISPLIGKLQNLAVLQISGCGMLTELPQSIGKLQNLAVLQISGCGMLTELPQSIADLRGLVSLIVTDCTEITAMPNLVKKMLYADRSMQQPLSLPQLSTLVLDNCTKLGALPTSLGTLTGITTLSVAGCTLLTQFPPGLGKLINLHDLDMRGCPALVPVTIVYLENLEVFKHTSTNPDIVMSALDLRVNAYSDMLDVRDTCWDETNDDAFPDKAITWFFSQMPGRDSDGTSTITRVCMLDWIPRKLILEHRRRTTGAAPSDA